MRRAALTLALACAPLVGGAVDAALRGHGGPVRAVAVTADGRLAITGSFDTSAILWRLDSDQALSVLRFHDKAVNAVAVTGPGRFATAGEDGRIALWTAGAAAPDRVLEGHAGPIAGLAVSSDGRWIASAAWDRTVRLWPRDGGAPLVLEGHRDNVNGVAFSPDGTTLVSAGYDATLRLWPLARADLAPVVVAAQAPLNAVAVAPDGEIVAAAADGRLYVFSALGQPVAAIEIAEAPIIALALSPDGTRIAASGLRGAVALVDRIARRIDGTLVGPALPVWSVAFTPDGRTLLAAGSDRLVRRWDARTGEAADGTTASGTDDILRRHTGDPGAEVFKACVACHTLTPDDGARAGPTLHNLFGRRIAAAPGYRYSEALTKLDIVWTPQTVARLFEVGPAAYTPGTKMPEQRLSAEERRALVLFLERAAQ